MNRNWHPAMAPSNGTTSTPPKLVVTLPPTIAHYNGLNNVSPHWKKHCIKQVALEANATKPNANSKVRTCSPTSANSDD